MTDTFFIILGLRVNNQARSGEPFLLFILRSFKYAIFFLQFGIWLADDNMLFQPNLIKRESQRFQYLLPFRWPQLTLPDGDAMPPHLSQSLLRLNITLLVPLDLRLPKLPIRIRYPTAPLMPMPKTSIHKDTSPVFSQHQIRMSRQSRRIKPISESPTPKPFPHNHLWLRILSSNRRHILVPLFCGELVHVSLFLFRIHHHF